MITLAILLLQLALLAVGVLVLRPLLPREHRQPLSGQPWEDYRARRRNESQIDTQRL